MSFASDTLIIVQTAYQEAVSGKSRQLNGRRWEQHDIAQMLDQVTHWTNEVAKENARASGGGRPMQMVP